MSIREKIEKSLKAGNEYKAGDFSKLGKNKSIHSAMGRLVEEGKLSKVSRGKYKALVGGKPTQSVTSGLKTNRFSSANPRGDFFSRIGVNFAQDRDTWHALGYHRKVEFKHYYEEFKRGGIAKRIITAPAKSTWRNQPIVSDEEGIEGDFATKWNELVATHAIYKQFERADIRARIGRFGIILLGLKGDLKLSPTGKNNELLYLNSFHSGSTEIVEFESSTSSRRFGLPLQYKVDLNGDLKSNTGNIASTEIHYNRVIHVAEDMIDDNVHGTPALEAVFNNLFDLLKVIGGSAEAVWRTFDRGMAILLDSDAELSEEDEEAFNAEVEQYIHHDQRFMKLQGADVKPLGAVAADPRGHFQVLASSIAGTTGIPQRILFGSERGQLASQADERNWNAQIKERQLDFAEPDILRPFLERCIDLGILPTPMGKINIEWPDLMALSEGEQVKNTKDKALAARNLEQVTYLTSEEKREMLGFDSTSTKDVTS